MQALLRDMRGAHPCRPVLVVSSDPAARGLALAREQGVPVAAVDRRSHSDRTAFEAALLRAILPVRPDIVCLAGFMRILTPGFVARFSGRILNIHPSLLPKYRGLDTHARALAAGDAEAGASVHEVTETLDGGPVLGRIGVPVLPDDTEETLRARVLQAEHRLYPAVLRRFAEGRRDVLHLTAETPVDPQPT